MGLSTHGFLKDDISATEIYNVVVSKFDKEAIFDIRYDNYDSTETGNIIFKYCGENRRLFYCLTRDKEEGTEFNSGKRHVTLILGYWGNSVEIMTEIVKCFGGYIDENDCDDIDAFYVPKDDEFKYDDYISQRNKLMEILDNGLSMTNRILIANQIIKHKYEVLDFLQS